LVLLQVCLATSFLVLTDDFSMRMTLAVLRRNEVADTGILALVGEDVPPVRFCPREACDL
jgi:hypothetical protein